DCQNNEDEPNHTGYDRSRMIELGINGGEANHEDQEGDVRIHEERENLFLQRHVVVGDLRSGSVKHCGSAIKSSYCFAVDLFKQVGGVLCHVVNQVLLQG